MLQIVVLGELPTLMRDPLFPVGKVAMFGSNFRDGIVAFTDIFFACSLTIPYYIIPWVSR